LDYGEILTRAWRITSRFRILWLFGILAGCGRQGGEDPLFNLSGGGSAPGSATQGLPPTLQTWMNDLLTPFHDLGNLWRVVAIVVGAICALAILQFFLGIMGQIGLIKGVADADGGAESLSMRALWAAGLRYFWRMFGLLFVIGSPVLVVALLFGIIGTLAAMVTYYGKAAGLLPVLLALSPIFLLLFCALLLVAIVIWFVSQMAQNAMILEEQGVVNGLRRGWQVLKQNVGPVLVVSILEALIRLAVAFIAGLPLLVLLSPLIFAFIMNANSPGFSATPWLAGGALILCIYIPLALLANGILNTYLQSVWTLAYLRLTKPGPALPDAAGSPVHA
jgi:hypothetical protein